jgi:poly-gamma-glutamate capsule biosynthesis protein CapA/YwtB (metallophosphatase superfamily)
MVTLNTVPPGEVGFRQVGLFHKIWIVLFVLICSLVGPQPISPRSPGILDMPIEKYWLYQREGGSLSTQDTIAEILVVGDVMLGRGIAGIGDPFKKIGQLLVSADTTVANFEGVISATGAISEPQMEQSGLTPYKLIAPARAAIQLQQAGFDLISLANNHSLDMRENGLKETIRRLASVGIETIGVGYNPETSYRPVIMDVKGVRVAFLAIDAIPEPLSVREMRLELQRATWNKNQVLATIRKADPVSDAIIVLIHWGDEYEVHAGPNQRKATLEMVEAGADVVIGSHPHVVQETQIIEKSAHGKEGFVAYSLGNFVFDQFEEDCRVGLALKIFIDKAGLRAIEALPIRAGPDPELLASGESKKLFERIRPNPIWVSFRCDLDACFPVHTIPGRGTGLFKSGQIDLNANGTPETVRLENGRVFILEINHLEWESPRDWQVMDVALGDPNDDGRGEVLLVLQKPDINGKLASHPFIIGHRGGIYRQVWGGSAVAIPIQEVELADIDGDGKQELIVLEEYKNGMKTIAIFRWDDWVYRLFWRSAPGRFVGLQVLETGGKQKVITIGKIK